MTREALDAVREAKPGHGLGSSTDAAYHALSPKFGLSDALIVAEGSNGEVEALPVRVQGRDLYEICCIPFHVRGIALGDVVRWREGGGISVETRSGATDFRIRSRDPETPVKVFRLLEAEGCDLELGAIGRIVGASVPAGGDVERVVNILQAASKAGLITVETDFQPAR